MIRQIFNFIVLILIFGWVDIKAQPHTSNNDYSDYWNGPIFSVVQTTAWYTENFGERQLSNIDVIRVNVFDEKGRKILDRYVSDKKISSTIYIYDDASADKSMTEITISMLDMQGVNFQTLYQNIKNWASTAFEDYINRMPIRTETHHKFEYNRNGILLKHDQFINDKQIGRFTQKWNPQKQAYYFENYGNTGNLINSGFCYYTGKRLVKADIQPWHESKIDKTYFYNNRGFITKHYDPATKKYFSGGIYTINPTNGFDEEILMATKIKYDSKGNPISYKSSWRENVWTDFTIQYVPSPTTLKSKSSSVIQTLLPCFEK